MINVERLQNIAHHLQAEIITNILDAIHKGEATLGRLQELMDVPADALYAVLEHLMDVGFVRQHDDSQRTYSLTEMGRKALDTYGIVAEFSRSFGI